MNYDLFGNATSSPGSASGASPPAAPDGQTMRPYGPVPALASLSARQAKEKALLTSGTSGPHSTISSSNAALRSSLASRLREQTEILGSTLYRLTWTQRRMPSGLLKPALRVSARPMSAAEIIGWPSPISRDWKGAPTLGPHDRGSKGAPLNETVRLAGWPSPTVMDTGNTGTAWESRRERVKANYPTGHNGFGLILPMTTQLAGWPTATATDAIRHPSHNYTTANITLNHAAVLAASNAPARLTVSGVMLTGFSAETSPYQSGGQLSPAHSLWLMLGPFATAWVSCGERVTLARSRKRKASSAPFVGS